MCPYPDNSSLESYMASWQLVEKTGTELGENRVCVHGYVISSIQAVSLRRFIIERIAANYYYHLIEGNADLDDVFPVMFHRNGNILLSMNERLVENR